MHSAPAVSCPVVPSRTVALAAWSLRASGTVCCAAAAVTMNRTEGGTWRWASMLAVSLLAGVVAWRHLRSAQAGVLNFDGQHWSFAGRARRLQVCLDFQTLMLLRLVSVGHSTRWIWLQSGKANGSKGQWRDVRRAVYSRAPTASDAGEPAEMPAVSSRPLSSR